MKNMTAATANPKKNPPTALPAAAAASFELDEEVAVPLLGDELTEENFSERCGQLKYFHDTPPEDPPVWQPGPAAESAMSLVAQPPPTS
jgi:hypothetical protein